MIVRSEQTKKNDVIDNAEKFIKVKTWHPTVDIAMCDPDYKDYKAKAINPYYEDKNFRSCFRKNKDYNVIPYVYTGQDDVDTFNSKIERGICPGGWDRTKGRATWFWWITPEKARCNEALKKYAYGYKTIHEFLAGVDCSNYVSRCWKLPGRLATYNFGNFCLGIQRNSLKAGDILNNESWGHVRIFNRKVGAKIEVYEARGGPEVSQIGNHKREFRNGDNTEVGCVVKRTIDWDQDYKPLSIFPHFTLDEPVGRPKIVGPRETFKITVKGSGKLKIGECRLGTRIISPIPMKEENSANETTIQLKYSPDHDLRSGSHYLLIKASNKRAGQYFQDDFFYRFEVLV